LPAVNDFTFRYERLLRPRPPRGVPLPPPRVDSCGPSFP
jgi:hypothetical protein